MKLYSLPLSPFAARVRLAIYRKGLEDKIEILRPPEGGTRGEAYLALNPIGQVPALALDSGLTLAESSVILEYLEDAFPEPSLRPADAEGLARMRLLLKLPDGYFMGAPRILLGMRQPEDRQPQLVAPAMENLHKALSYTEHYIGKGAWAVGDLPTLADCALVPVLNAVNLIAMVHDEPDLLAPHPKLHAYWTQARQEPINARVIAEQLAAVPPIPTGVAA
ncbi:MAG: hypothetical protein A4S16_09080 [Proteobacteria bacterium SG_bin6]|nr:MAG: hypothetical protein A4S16_09080 [Proteobacteria bacterium SG_bin6]